MATCGMEESLVDEDVPGLLSDSYGDEPEEDSQDWEDMEEEINLMEGEVTCLFCKQRDTMDETLKHLRTAHEFHLVEICSMYSVDCISYIKMINYIRLKRPSVGDIKTAIQTGNLWASDDFMTTADPDDLMLQFDIETAQTAELSERTKASINGELSDLNESKAVAALIQRTKRAEEERDLLREELDRALKDMEKLRLTGQKLVIGANEPKVPKSSRQALHEDDSYFASYSHFGIHQTMLMDKVRTESYRDFMLQNPEVFRGKTVLDVGCGTGILSMFAAKAGAAKVVAVDQSHIIYQAMDIARENNLHEKITFVKGRLEDVTLPVEKFDIIISEWMGYFLLFEAMLDSVLWARDHCLISGGCVYPDHLTMHLVGLADPDLRHTLVDYWDDVYGFKMSCMKTPVLGEVHVKRLSGKTVATDPALIKDIDVMTSQVKDLDFSSDFSLLVQQDCDITAIVGYFDTNFDHHCQKKVSFSTGPQATPTHWDQAVMMLPKPISAVKGSHINGSITYRKHPRDDRGVTICLTVDKQKLKYSLS